MTDGFFHKLWRVVYPALLLVVIYLAVYFCAMLAYDNFFSTDFSGFDDFMTTSAASGVVSLAAALGGAVAGIILFRKDKVASSQVILRKPFYFAPVVIAGALGGHGLSILVSFISYSGALGTYTQNADMLSTQGLILAVIKAVIIGPLAEELIYRGVIFNRVKSYSGFWGAALISSLLFAVGHFNLLQGIYAFIWGIALCFVYVTFENIWATIAMHAAANALALAYEYFGVAYPSIAVYAIVMAVCLATAAGIIIILHRKVRSCE